MLEPVRRFAASRVKPLVSEKTWQNLRDLDPRRDRQEQERALEAKLTRQIRARVKRELEKESARSLFRASRGLGLTRPLREVLGEIDPILAAMPKARIALVVDRRAAAVAALISARHRRVRIVEVSATVDESARHVALAATGPFDLIIDAVAERDDPLALLISVLYHLKPRGHLAIADFRPLLTGRDDLWPNLASAVATQAAQPDSGAAGQPPTAAESPDEDRAHDSVDEPLLEAGDADVLAGSLGRIVVGDGYLIVQNKIASLAKLREAEMAPLLELAGPRLGVVLEHTEPETFTPRSVVTDHRVESVIREEPDIEVPALELRSYDDVLAVNPQLVTKDNLLLVETFRHHLYDRMVHRFVTEVAPRFGQIDRDLSRPMTLPGPYFHWDSEWPGHFGHVLTEQVSRLWGLQSAMDRHPDLKILLGRRPKETRAMSFERAVLAAVGVPEEKILLYDRPARVDRLLAATPMFSMPEYVSPRIESIWDRIGDRIVAEADGRATPKRIFCGRERTNRSCHNAAEVEALFREFGFDIVFPEHLSFPEQIAMFRNADVVAGYAGSALFTLMFCPDVKPVIMLAPESYTANNEYLIAAVRGHRFDVFWSEPDVDELLSSYSFDFDREGRLLAEYLRSLS